MSESNGKSFGPVELLPGVSRANAAAKLLASGTTIAALAGMSILQGYILVEHLNVPSSMRGQLSGDLAVAAEVIMLLFFVPFGILSDRIGRRPVYVLGIVLVGLSWVLSPFAETVTQLYLYRVFYAVGVAATTGALATLVNDYPTDATRGKYIAMTAMVNVIGTVFVARVIGGIPEMMSDQGYSAVSGGRAMFVSMGLICFFTAVIAAKYLKAGTVVDKKVRPKAKELYKSGLRAARNTRIGISYAAALAARSDVVVKGIFLSLWAIESSEALGLSTGQAMAQFGGIIGAMYVVSFLTAPLFGWYIDKVDRMTAMCTALFVAATGYLLMYFVSSPVNYDMIPYLVLLTLGTGFMVKTQSALIGQEATVADRGSIIATAQVFGGIGILIFTAIGGRLFDSVGPWAPFFAVGIYQGLVFVAALAVRFSTVPRLSQQVAT